MAMGIGIDTGELVAGYMGSTKTMNYTVIGSPVNLASRLCGVAAHNEILISQRTRAFIGDRAEVDTGQALKLKGFQDAVTPLNVLRLTESS